MATIVGSTKDYTVGDIMKVHRAGQYAMGRIVRLNATREDYIKQVKSEGLNLPRQTYSSEARFYYVELD